MVLFFPHRGAQGGAQHFDLEHKKHCIKMQIHQIIKINKLLKKTLNTPHKPALKQPT